MDKGLVTVTIPTYNSGHFLGLCLESIKNQTYKNIEVNIIDGGSNDNTKFVAEDNGIKNFYEGGGSLLKSRYIGLQKAKGEYILILDSDQILEPTTIERAVGDIKNKSLDMIVLEEDVYKKDTWLEKLFSLDRELIHKVKDFNPYTGVMLPRFYKVDLLKKAFANIPKTSLDIGGQDHAIIYYEAWKHSTKVGLLPNAVKHIEPPSLRVLIRKFYRWGYTSVGAHRGKYSELISRKEHFRTGLFRRGLITASFGSITLLILKGIPYKLGYLVGKVESRNTKNKSIIS